MKKILTLFIIMISLSVFAQKRAITGTVKDAAGMPLPGVSLIVKGTNIGSQTDLDGNYTIMAESKNALIFTFIGMKTKSVPVGNKAIINVSMEEDAATLDEVVVIGYGTVKKKDLTGSVSTIDTDEAFVAPVANVQNAMQGRASGVQVVSNNGSPGAAPEIIIRGGNSITGGNDPLYVIDGFVGAGNLSSIDPNDIESMQVLKDASSTAIYGARGTNGVILITTKKGKKGKAVVNFRTSSGIQFLSKRIDVQNSSELASWLNDITTDQANLPYDLDNLPGGDVNWQDVLIRPAVISDYQLSASGGNDNAQYYISGGYLNQDGIVKGSSFERFNFRTNIDVKLSKTFKVGANVLLSRTNNDNDDVSFQQLLREDPSKPIYNEDGSYYVGDSPILGTRTDHLLANAELNQDDTHLNKIFVNTYIQASLFDGLVLKSTFNGDFLFSKRNQFTPSTNPSKINNNNQLASGSVITFNDSDFLNENTLDYSRRFGDHSFNILAAATFQTHNRETTNVSASNIPSDGVGINALQLAPAEYVNVSSAYTDNSLVGFLGRINYTLKDRYLFTASVRRDGSSRLGLNNRYENFPSAAIGWKINEEPFMENVNFVDNLKLRLSYGKTGNQGANPYVTIANVGIVNNTILVNGVRVPGVTQGNLAKPDLGWEITNQYDAGLEFSLFKSRLSAEIDVYYKKTEDLLLNEPQVSFTGYDTQLANVGSVENRGIDFTLNAVLVRTKDFQWDASLNISHYENKVLDLGRNTYIETKRLTAPANDRSGEIRVGQPIGIFVGALYEGFDPATGTAIFKDISGPNGVPDGVYSAEYDDTIIGNANPDIYGGFQSNFKYKNFNLQVFFTYSLGNENYNEEAFRAIETTTNSYASIRNNMWTVNNQTDALYPGFDIYNYNKSSSLYVQDASYLRLGTLQLGYTLPKGTIKGFSKLRTYVTGTNLFILKSKDYWGFDPDVSTGGALARGYDAIAYPKNTSVVFGVDMTF
ncbi:SusC/RagA family TonB-linked outer membrane protein [Flavobacterium algicola]|uniref:SusC/RagA family TonB-linked outer membrane protein n=1 Tax=Flavobacterium algicola TaxID=556529 RepID=UPI001EFE5D87|nr:TonB-dependent receptor [Flavobacterium algicola]MCG9792324.1 TonB-dependent receptor [Flavobacterium algicola]